jgi:hypothetical protein
MSAPSPAPETAPKPFRTDPLALDQPLAILGPPGVPWQAGRRGWAEDGPEVTCVVGIGINGNVAYQDPNREPKS